MRMELCNNQSWLENWKNDSLQSYCENNLLLAFMPVILNISNLGNGAIKLTAT